MKKALIAPETMKPTLSFTWPCCQKSFFRMKITALFFFRISRSASREKRKMVPKYLVIFG